MTTRDLVSLAMKIIGVYYLVQSAALFLSIFTSGGFTLQSPFFVQSAGLLALVLLLLFGSGAIARLFVPEERNSTVSSGLSLGDWQAIFFSAIGVSTIVQALRSLSGFFYYPKHQMQTQVLVSGIVMIIIGLLLFAQARGLANLWRSIQEQVLKR